jgi:hypothetical protein
MMGLPFSYISLTGTTPTTSAVTVIVIDVEGQIDQNEVALIIHDSFCYIGTHGQFGLQDWSSLGDTVWNALIPNASAAGYPTSPASIEESALLYLAFTFGVPVAESERTHVHLRFESGFVGDSLAWPPRAPERVNITRTVRKPGSWLVQGSFGHRGAVRFSLEMEANMRIRSSHFSYK